MSTRALNNIQNWERLLRPNTSNCQSWFFLMNWRKSTLIRRGRSEFSERFRRIVWKSKMIECDLWQTINSIKSIQFSFKNYIMAEKTKLKIPPEALKSNLSPSQKIKNQNKMKLMTNLTTRTKNLLTPLDHQSVEIPISVVIPILSRKKSMRIILSICCWIQHSQRPHCQTQRWWPQLRWRDLGLQSWRV